MNLDELQQSVDAYIRRSGGYFGVLTNLARLLEEAGEVAHILGRTDGELRARPGQRIDREALIGEFGDLLFITAALANQKDVRLVDAITRALGKTPTPGSVDGGRPDPEPGAPA